jgi:putative transposase
MQRVPHPWPVLPRVGSFGPLVFLTSPSKFSLVPWSLKRFQQSRQLHFITFSCYRRQPRLNTPKACHLLLRQLEIARRRFAMCVYGYVVMPEHVHLLVNEPGSGQVSTVIQSLKQTVARMLGFEGAHFWQRRYYDFNVWSERKRIEKLRYMHRNPVRRGLVEKPEDWPWSSFRHYLYGEEGIVEIESDWTARERESMGLHPVATMRSGQKAPPLAKPAKGRAP